MIRKIITMSLLFASVTYGANGKLNESDQKALKESFKKYEALHKDFFEYDASKAQKEAKDLKASLEKIKDPELSKLLKISKQKLAEIGESESREENNQNMHLVSLALIHVMKNYNVGANYKAFQCPMVKKKWIQNVEEVKVVQNPYAPQMPNCGGLDK